MSSPNDVTDFLDALARVLARCFILGLLLLLTWSGLLVFARDWIHQVHSTWIDLAQHELSLIHYGGIALLKLWLLMFFLFPYIALRLVVRKRRKRPS